MRLKVEYFGSDYLSFIFPKKKIILILPEINLSVFFKNRLSSADTSPSLALFFCVCPKENVWNFFSVYSRADPTIDEMIHRPVPDRPNAPFGQVKRQPSSQSCAKTLLSAFRNMPIVIKFMDYDL